jgi:hypothetical protein
MQKLNLSNYRCIRNKDEKDSQAVLKIFFIEQWAHFAHATWKIDIPDHS